MATPTQERPPQPPDNKVGYEALRECHKRAYAYLTEALQIDEGGVGKNGEGVRNDVVILVFSVQATRTLLLITTPKVFQSWRKALDMISMLKVHLLEIKHFSHFIPFVCRRRDE